MDSRATTAAYYDLEPAFPADIPFYLEQIPGPTCSILELGCGTGRVTLPLARRADFVQAVDLSPAMVARCLERLQRAGIDPLRATAEIGDITQLDLGKRFDLILAPYRVFQNLASDREVAGLFETIHAHLAPGGHCILNTFRPYADAANLIERWKTPAEDLDWEQRVGSDVVRCFARRGRVQAHPLVIYPDLVYRRYRGERLVEEVTASIAMRCWYPAELQDTIQKAGFRVTAAWGGYAGEVYGTGDELIVRFATA